MRKPEEKLRIVLYVVGGVCSASIIGVIAPWSCLQNWTGFQYGVELPDDVMVQYCLRMACAVYTLVGVYFLVLARRPLYYIRFFNVGIAGLILAGMVALIAGMLLKLDWWGYVVDVAFFWITGVLLLVLSRSRDAARRRRKRPYHEE